MRIILTHEQADFDALAAVLAASMLQEGDIPVAPRKMNRNVRSYFTLYGNDLPFVDFRDLPVDPIEQITLVDTQSLVTLKGMARTTRVSIIDHHTVRPDLDPSWVIQVEPTGAATTILVEAIQESGREISTEAATLLLLGIYEDTGSLAYASTTARDIRCAAYLVDQGASLKVASSYLNPPLSIEQRELYERLLISCTNQEIQHCQIIIAAAAAEGMVEEVSSIAHKIRDLLEPDGLFILVSTEEGYRLVARSTSDKVNVAAVARHFGGGGHDRAAAALIQRKSTDPSDPMQRLEELKAELISLLPQYIHPPIAVGQIMSRRPRMLEPQTSVQDAAKLMQRYGYEGFPVVENQKILGLLTRRAVDRAMSHKLNLKALSLMESGDTFVHPTDSLEYLQKVMTNSGWGQVPVFDPEKQEIVGIVTRTDLLKVLGKSVETRQNRNIANLLESSLSPDRIQLLHFLAKNATEEHMNLYIVGGFVRDLLVKRPSQDFDIVVEGDAVSLGKKLSNLYGGRLVTHSRFGTAKWFLQDLRKPFEFLTDITSADLPSSLDLITARTEFYEKPTALPTVERSGIKLDLHRRDFSMNTLAIRLDGRHYGELLDFWGGYQDLQNGKVRVLHSLSFIDDPTRILRAVRFEQRFGFQIEQRTGELMDESADRLHQISGERLRHEFDLLFSEDHPGKVLEKLQQLGILTSIHPDLKWQPDWSSVLENLLNQNSGNWQYPEFTWGLATRRILGYTFWWMHFSFESIWSFAKIFRLSAHLEKVISQAVDFHASYSTLPGKPISQIVRTLDRCNELALRAVASTFQDEQVTGILEQYFHNWRTISSQLDGRDLKKLGIPTGPVYSQILSAIRDAWLDGIITSPDQEQEFVQQYIKQH